MKALIAALIIFVVVFVPLCIGFPRPFEGWYDYLYALFTIAVGIGLFGVIKSIVKLIRNN